MPIIANVIEDAFSPLIRAFESIMVFIHDNVVGGSWGAGDRRADGADPRGARAADLPAAEGDAGDAAAVSADRGAEREVQGRQTAPAAGDHGVLPGEQNQPAGVVPAAAAAAAGVHLAVLHAAHRPEARHLWQAAARPLLERAGAPDPAQRRNPGERGDARRNAHQRPVGNQLQRGGAALGEVPVPAGHHRKGDGRGADRADPRTSARRSSRRWWRRRPPTRTSGA